MNWQRKKLEDIADFTLGKMLDEKKNRGDLLPYLANINVRWGSFDLDELREMKFEEHEKDRFGLKDGDIVMCEGGEPGRCAIWKDQNPNMMIQKALHRIRPYEDVDARFLFYSFLHKGKAGGFAPLFTGATIKHLPKEKLAKVEVDIPPLQTQKQIAFILSAYDDLIENNRRRIQLLEESARLLYKEWFVQLRFPGHEHVKITGGVPEGWSKKPIKEILTLNYGKALHADLREAGEFPVYGSSGVVGSHNKPLVKAPGIIVGRKGNVGSIFWVSKDYWPIDTVYFVIPEESSLYLYHALQKASFINTDVAVPGLNRDMAYSREILIPADNVLSLFHDEVEPVQRQIEKLGEYNNKLTEARDILLPRLMNGELVA